MRLVALGVPWAVAIDLSPVEALGLLVAAGEAVDGGTFNWAAMRWDEK